MQWCFAEAYVYRRSRVNLTSRMGRFLFFIFCFCSFFPPTIHRLLSNKHRPGFGQRLGPFLGDTCLFCFFAICPFLLIGRLIFEMEKDAQITWPLQAHLNVLFKGHSLPVRKDGDQCEARFFSSSSFFPFFPRSFQLCCFCFRKRMKKKNSNYFDSTHCGLGKLWAFYEERDLRWFGWIVIML